MAQETYTAMSDDGIDAVIRAIPQHVNGDKPFDVSFNASDLGFLVLALKNAYEHASDMGCEGTDDIDANDGDAAEWAGQYVSDIAGQFGIEFI